MRTKVRKSKRRKLSIICVILAIILAGLVIFEIEKNIGPTAEIQSEHFAKVTANQIISETISNYLEENSYQYNDFAVVLYDEIGQAVSVEALTYNINKVQSDLILKINQDFEESKNLQTKIPIGTLTNSYLMSGKGPSVPLKISSANSTQVELKSEFISAGINQTCHRISAVIKVEISSSVPLYNFSTETSFEFLLAENIIVGDVPEYRTFAVS